MNKNCATKIQEIPETTTRLFNAAQAAILVLIGKFAANAIEANNRAVLINFGQRVNELLNSALSNFEHDKNQTIN